MGKVNKMVYGRMQIGCDMMVEVKNVGLFLGKCYGMFGKKSRVI